VANPHNRIDDVHLTAGTPDLEEDPVAAYLEYYDERADDPATHRLQLDQVRLMGKYIFIHH
jgi:hypothetical protein